MSASAVESLLNHIALPPRLPGKREDNIREIEQALIERLSVAARLLRDNSTENHEKKLHCLLRSIQICGALNTGGGLERKSLVAQFSNLEEHHVLILHIVEQNSGILISPNGGNVVFESFEASATSEKALAAESTLTWAFPGSAVSIPDKTFMDISFQHHLASFLEQANIESVKRFAAHTRKAGTFTFESRDTADPALITKMLMTLLEVNGYRMSPSILQKRIRDDVCWEVGAELPWRRCAFWTVLRVGMQRHLYTLFGPEVGRTYYKFLISIVHARLLEESLPLLGPEPLHFLKAKICRRLAKLEIEKERSNSSACTIYEHLFVSFKPTFYNIIRQTSEQVETRWARFKKAIQRPIHSLPRRADFEDLYLTLPNSQSYLQTILSEPLQSSVRSTYSTEFHLLTNYDAHVSKVSSQFNTFATGYFPLADFEVMVENDEIMVPGSKRDCQTVCVEVGTRIRSYIDKVGRKYDSSLEEKSIMLLTIMELWVCMDQCANKLYSFLREFNPIFPNDILDVLHLSRLVDMSRLQRIQTYLKERHLACKAQRTIFDDPINGCFAERYFNESEHSLELQALEERIKFVAETARARKQREWEKLTADYEKLLREVSQSTCIYMVDELQPLMNVHDDHHCRKCFLERQARRMRIEVHEHPLPSNETQARTVVFEIVCPEAFRAYRNTTWKILAALAYPEQRSCQDPVLLLRNYNEILPYKSSSMLGISLASTKKSFLNTHYARVKFPTPLQDVCLPNGLKLGYYDEIHKAWPSRQQPKATFAHHFRTSIPKLSPFSSLGMIPDYCAGGSSSYEVIASQSKCPPGLNVHEFIAYQALCFGKHLRWHSILMELGSSNLNFSTEATGMLVSRLALHAGPQNGDDCLRTIHGVFRNVSFCDRFLQQLEQRLLGISSNWREINCLGMLIILITRVYSLTPLSQFQEIALSLLKKARTISFDWLSVLRKQVQQATDVNTSKTCSRYAFWASLLCRNTFRIHADEGTSLLSSDLQCFIECSIALQDNLNEDPVKLPDELRSALIRDTKMTYRMGSIIRRSLENYPDALMAAVNSILPDSGIGPSKRESRVVFPSTEKWWAQSTWDSTDQTASQTIHYHLLRGLLLIDGKPLGKLPQEYATSVVLHELFPNQNLLTCPSRLPGMTYRLAMLMGGHEIHFGFRRGDLVVRASIRGITLEFVPRKLFGTPSHFDLPASLVENCFHWINLQTGEIEVRQKPNIWHHMGFNTGNWTIDFYKREARRRKVSLVDPHCHLFQQFAKVFDRFESHQHLTVYQSAKGGLWAQLRRLELSFKVNSNNVLESPELRSEIDPNQDAGTWYGLNSKLVLRETLNPLRRSIIVPMGTIKYKRNGMHVAVDVDNEGDYGRFAINTVLGRLECPAEPRLLYTKARFHAYTSFLVPDPLTGRTGGEEALHCLKAGYCQPWTPLASNPYQSLISLAVLSPRRTYYPADLKVMQKVSWNDDLTTIIQREEFQQVVEEIRRKSEELSLFSVSKSTLELLPPSGDSHLAGRNIARLRNFRRPEGQAKTKSDDLAYQARDQSASFRKDCANVFESISVIRDWQVGLPAVADLAGIMQTWPHIEGFGTSFDKVLLSDLLAIDFAHQWGSLVTHCSSFDRHENYKLMFFFGVLSFRVDINMNILKTLIAFSVLHDLKSLEPPTWPFYSEFSQHNAPRIDHLLHLIKPCYIPYVDDKRSTIQYMLSAKHRRKLEAAELAHERQVEEECKLFARHLLNQWPCWTPVAESFTQSISIDTERALTFVAILWRRLFENFELWSYTGQVQNILDRHGVRGSRPISTFIAKGRELLPSPCCENEVVLLHELLQKNGVTDQKCLFRDDTYHNHNEIQMPASKIISPEITELGMIIKGIASSRSHVRQRYGQDLQQSLCALKKRIQETTQPLPELQGVSVDLHRENQVVEDAMTSIRERLVIDEPRAEWLQLGGLWPCITPVTLLEQIRSSSLCNFGFGMKESIVNFAVSVTSLQRLMRIVNAIREKKLDVCREEQKNPGHSNWNPVEHTDWLLLEIDANILLRRDQVEVALATISPASGSNSVLQMNMGQGKTSCIMPMVAANMADKKRLLRIIVPNSLLLQTAQLLHVRLGGLLGREVRHVPFSRKTPTTSNTIKTYHAIHREMLKSSGVMLGLPEHIMSFMLSGLQRLSDNRMPEATSMVKIQSWLTNHCRDVLDECDFTLAVRTQLIYPSGAHAIVDGSPHRWETAETLLHLVEGHLWNLQHDFPQSMELITRPQGGFPVVFLLRKDVEEALLRRLLDDVCSGRSTILPTRDCTTSDQIAIKHYISDPKISRSNLDRISSLFPGSPSAKQNLQLLRGLFVHRILLLALKKRWNVQYGLDPKRDPIAVPFHAKGVPSEQAEWGHPDVAILFTCLAFYYDGLNISQLRQSLEHVLKSDDPSGEYDRWTSSSQSLPDSLHEWNSINVDDETQLAEIWQHVRYNMIVVDYFLNHFVFPLYAKQFHMKLQASGWDIPLFSPTQNILPPIITKSMTTGFSGTNDNRSLMPLTITQADLPGLSHTNAEVLTYLLQPRNRQYVVAADSSGRRFSELKMLKQLEKRKIRVLIDAGAQILEMDNLSLAKAWLKIDYAAPAAVYFDPSNKPFVLYQKGYQIPLLASPFADNLENCLVYLDEAHTRGTDLKISPTACGALTLGLGQTKDHTVQAAMRLRQLRTSQTLIFFAPPEVHQSILDVRKKVLGAPIDSYDVVCWLLEQTCDGIEQLQPLHFSQGLDFCRRTQAAMDNANFLSDSSQRDNYLRVLRQTEQQTLEQLYAPRLKTRTSISAQVSTIKLTAFLNELNSRRTAFQDNGNAVHASALQEVEQEREVAFEVEAVREVQKPVHYEALQFPGLHRDILSYAKTGRLAIESAAYELAFSCLRRTSIGRKFKIGVQNTSSMLFVSTEFSKTIKLAYGTSFDTFQRHTNWVLWSSTSNTALVVIPEEAERLIPVLYNAKVPVVHLLTYAAPVTLRMLHFNRLNYYLLPDLQPNWEAPRWLRIELGVFAGRLYFEYDELSDLYKFLSLHEHDETVDVESTLELENSIETGEEEEEEVAASSVDNLIATEVPRSFAKRPLTFLQEWLTLKRKGQDFVHTPMGYVCHGKSLVANHPFFVKRENSPAHNVDSKQALEESSESEHFLYKE